MCIYVHMAVNDVELGTTLFVRNLPFDTTEDAVRTK